VAEARRLLALVADADDREIVAGELESIERRTRHGV